MVARVRGVLVMRDAAQLDIVFGRDGDLGVGLEAAIAAAELGARVGEDRFVVLRTAAGSGWNAADQNSPVGSVADIAEGAPVVAGGVFAPARDRQILPAAVAAARIGDHHVVPAVGQQLHLGRRRVGIGEDAHRRFGATGSRRVIARLRRGASRTPWPGARAPAAAAWWPETAGPTRSASAWAGPAADRRARAGSCPGDAP